MVDYTQWPVIGCGSERICYQNPQSPNRCLKVSRLGKSKQATRELRYFLYLIKKGVPFSLIPNFYGVVIRGEFIGIEQELILDEKGNVPPTLDNYLNNKLSESQKNRFWSAIEETKSY